MATQDTNTEEPPRMVVEVTKDCKSFAEISHKANTKLIGYGQRIMTSLDRLSNLKIPDSLQDFEDKFKTMRYKTRINVSKIIEHHHHLATNSCVKCILNGKNKEDFNKDKFNKSFVEPSKKIRSQLKNCADILETYEGALVYALEKTHIDNENRNKDSSASKLLKSMYDWLKESVKYMGKGVAYAVALGAGMSVGMSLSFSLLMLSSGSAFVNNKFVNKEGANALEKMGYLKWNSNPESHLLRYVIHLTKGFLNEVMSNKKFTSKSFSENVSICVKEFKERFNNVYEIRTELTEDAYTIESRWKLHVLQIFILSCAVVNKAHESVYSVSDMVNKQSAAATKQLTYKTTNAVIGEMGLNTMISYYMHTTADIEIRNELHKNFKQALKKDQEVIPKELENRRARSGIPDWVNAVYGNNKTEDSNEDEPNVWTKLYASINSKNALEKLDTWATTEQYENMERHIVGVCTVAAMENTMSKQFSKANSFALLSELALALKIKEASRSIAVFGDVVFSQMTARKGTDESAGKGTDESAGKGTDESAKLTQDLNTFFGVY